MDGTAYQQRKFSASFPRDYQNIWVVIDGRMVSALHKWPVIQSIMIYLLLNWTSYWEIS